MGQPRFNYIAPAVKAHLIEAQRRFHLLMTNVVTQRYQCGVTVTERQQRAGSRYLGYSRGWTTKRVRPNGEIYWQGRSRFIGEAFVRQEVALKPGRQDHWRVYFYDWLIGEIHASDLGAMRPAVYRRRHKPKVSAMS